MECWNEEFLFFFPFSCCSLLCFVFDCRKGLSYQELEVEARWSLPFGRKEETIEEWGLGRIRTSSPFPLSLYFLKHKVKKLNNAIVD